MRKIAKLKESIKNSFDTQWEPISDFERQQNIGLQMDLERQRLEKELGRPLNRKELSNTRKGVTIGPGPNQIRPGETIGDANKFFDSYNDPLVNTKWPKIRPSPQDVGKGRVIWSGDSKVRLDQQRTYSSTGVLPDGTFADSAIIRQRQKLDRKSMWPIGKSMDGFIEEVNKAWNVAGIDTKLMKTEQGGLRIDKGHVVPASAPSGIFSQGGANYVGNLFPQPGLASPNIGIDDTPYQSGKTAVTFDAEGNIKEWSANVPQQNTIFKDREALRVWDMGHNLSEAFNDYLIRDAEGVIDYRKIFSPQQLGEMAHRKGVSVDELGFKYEQMNAEDESRMYNSVQSFEAPKDPQKNPTIPGQATLAEVDKIKNPTSRAKGLMNAIKNTFSSKNATIKVSRGLARAAGMSNNPLVNIAGDVIGASIDGVVFAANPTAENAVDLGLSLGQVVTTGAGMFVAAMPVPGARPTAYVIMKLGDNINKANKALATMERLWGMSRESRDIASGRLKLRKGENQILEVKKSGTNLDSRPATQLEAQQLQKRFNMPTLKHK